MENHHFKWINHDYFYGQSPMSQTVCLPEGKLWHFFFTEKPTAGGSTAASRGLVRHEDAVLMEHLVIPKEFTEQPHGRQMWTPPNMR
jgi:hypothetical protein